MSLLRLERQDFLVCVSTSQKLAVKLMRLVEGNEQPGARRTMAQLCVAAGSSAESAECSHAWIELHNVFQGMGWLVRMPRPLERCRQVTCIALRFTQVYSYDTAGWTEFISVAAKGNKSLGSKKRRSASGDGSDGTGGSGRRGRRHKNRP